MEPDTTLLPSRSFLANASLTWAQRRARSANTIASFAAAGLLTVASVGCGDTEDPAAQPAPDGTAFVEGDFSEIPIFRAATPLQEPSTDEGVTTASYATETASARRVIDYYAENLPALGWQVVDPPVRSATGVWRADWLKDRRRLQVIASPLEPSDDATHTQIDLVLLNDAGEVHVGTVPGRSVDD